MSIGLAVLVSLRLFNLSAAPPSTIAQAERSFVQTFAAIDVRVDWSADPSALLLIIRDDEPGDLRGAWQPVLGAAIHTAHGSPVAYVFYHRVMDQARRYDIPAAAVLAAAMAHEVGHLLLPTRDHARDGLMRACWEYRELVRAADDQLRFSDSEGAEIRARALVLSRW